MSLPVCFVPPGAQPPAWVDRSQGPFGKIGGGATYHGPWSDGHWIASPAGWSVLLTDHLPQHLVRATPHPRVLRTVAIPGALRNHLWLVPVLLRPVGETDDARLFEPALDRVWRGADWHDPEDLTAVVQAALDAASEAPGTDPAALPRLAAAALALTHHVDLDLLALLGWLTEATMARVVRAVCGLEEGVPC